MTEAAIKTSTPVPLGVTLPGPRGWQAMLKDYPEERLIDPGTIALDAGAVERLLAVEFTLRSGWAFMPEPPGRDAWNPRAFNHATGRGRGDCEDFALAARQIAARRGFPREAFRLALCKTEVGADHAVLAIDTDAGVFVLDLAKPGLWAWSELPYAWLAIEVPRYGWRAIAAPLTLADLAAGQPQA